MAFDWEAKVAEFVATPSLSNAGYCVSVEECPSTGRCVRWIGAYLCTVEESSRNHLVYIVVLDENNNIVRFTPKVKWDWAGRTAKQTANPFYLDKAAPEIPGNLPIWKEEYVWLSISEIGGVAIDSDVITGMTGEWREDQPAGHDDDLWHKVWLVVGKVYTAGDRPVRTETSGTTETTTTTSVEFEALAARVTALEAAVATLQADVAASRGAA